MSRQVNRKDELLTHFVMSQGCTHSLEACRTAVSRRLGELPRTRGGEVDLEAVVERIGARLLRKNDTPFEGMIERDGFGKATIVLRRGLNRRRERFTLAHELGHWILQEEMLGSLEGQLFRGISRNRAELREEESLANLLAAEILLPFDIVSRQFDPALPLASIRVMCRNAGVSRMVAIRRIADVININLVFLQLCPYVFDDPNSATEIDDAIYVTSHCGTLMDRRRSKFVEKIPYSEVVNAHSGFLSLTSPKGPVKAVFEFESHTDPIPHSFALSIVKSWSSVEGIH